MKKIWAFILIASPLLCRCQVADSSLRQVQLQGAVNFRDIGGYVTSDGHRVKWHKIYRSADISKLTENDLLIIRQKKIIDVVDLRGVNESKNAPDKLNPGMDYILCPAGSDGDLNNWMKSLSTVKTKAGGDSMMIAYYANTQFLADRYKPMFAKLDSLSGDSALLLHCTAGKDRTGIGTALILYALGVPYETIVQDYIATNYYRAGDNEQKIKQMVNYMHINEAVATDLLSAKKEFLDATFAAIKNQYGSVNNYLKQEMGLDEQGIQSLKIKYLE